MSEQQIEEQEEESVEEQVTEESEGKEPVELTPEQQARFNRIYGNMKEYERQNAQLIADQRRLAKKTETLQERLESFVQDSTAQRREALAAEKAAAYQEGDIDKVIKIDGQIENLKDPEPIPEPEPVEPEISPAVVAQIQSWRNEIDEDGAFKRPWAMETHPRFNEFASLAQDVANRNAHLDNDSVLDLIDKEARQRFVPKKQTQTVLSGNGATPPKDKGIALNAEQKDIARKMYSKMSPKDAEARYAKDLKALEAE